MTKRDIKKVLNFLKKQTPSKKEELKYKVYYHDDGTIVTYTTDKVKNKKFIYITKEQYLLSRMDAKVVEKKLVLPELRNAFSKLEPAEYGIECESYDVNLIADSTEFPKTWDEIVKYVK